MMELYYQNNVTGETFDLASVAESITLKTVMRGASWSLEVICFTDIALELGSPVAFKVDGKEVFFGYLTKVKKTKNSKISLTFHDQVKYLLQSINYLAKDKDINAVVSSIAKDFSLKTGELKGPSKVLNPILKEDKKALDIIQECMDEVLITTGQMLVLYDKFGKLTLKSPKNLPIPYIIGDGSFLSDFEHEESIEDSANVIRLVQENKETKKREIYIYKDSDRIKKWGKLQLQKSIDEAMTEGQIKEFGENLLKLKNKPKETFSLSSEVGDVAFLAGHAVYIDVAEIKKKGWYIINEATHNFTAHKHTMDIKLFIGGGDGS